MKNIPNNIFFRADNVKNDTKSEAENSNVYVKTSTNPKKQSKSKRQSTFVLKNIDTVEIDKKYKLRTVSSNFDIVETPAQATKVDDLTNLRSKSQLYSFLDENKKYYVTMIDYITGRELRDKTTDMCCFWCRFKFESIPIGCPVKYVSDKIIKHYTSEITKEKYNICQKITKATNDVYTKDMKPEEKLIRHGYYETDGVFCSFNCCIAFIQDHNYHPMYKHSYFLTMKMYREIKKSVSECNGVEMACFESVKPSPSWRVLREYGGFMTIDEYRNSLDNYVYIDKHVNITKLPQTKMIGKIYEEQYIF